MGLLIEVTSYTQRCPDFKKPLRPHFPINYVYEY